jgi:hypothetical protein
MHPHRALGACLIACALTALPASAQAPAHRLADGKDWQNSSMEQRRAYLVGVSNVISVGARYDSRLQSADTFAQHAQKGLQGADLETALATIDAWYKAHPDELDRPVLSVIWRELAKREPVG